MVEDSNTVRKEDELEDEGLEDLDEDSGVDKKEDKGLNVIQENAGGIISQEDAGHVHSHGETPDHSINETSQTSNEPKIVTPKEEYSWEKPKTIKPDSSEVGNSVKINMGELKKYAIFVVVVALLIIGYAFIKGNGPGSGSGVATGDVVGQLPPTQQPPEIANVEVSIDDDAIKGNKDAPVTIIEFSDYECPFCARFYTQTLGLLQSEYIDTGKVRLIYRDFPLNSIHPQAQKAAEAAECAGEQGKYYEMHDKLFESGVVGGVTTYKKYAGDLGLDQGDFDSCLDSGEMASEVAKDLADGSSYGVQGTPAFFINGKLISGAQPFPAFQQAIEAELAG